MSKQKPLDSLTKTKLLIQGEYLLIAMVFLVVGILRLVGIMKSSETRGHIFIILTLVGAIWIITDFIWSTFSEKRHAKVTYLDKCIMLPMGLWLATYDIISLVRWNNPEDWYRYGIGWSFVAIFVLYSFQAIYHWFIPTKAVLEIVEEERKEKEQEALEKAKEANKVEEIKTEDNEKDVH